jgi:flagellar hook-length control protein FliK
MDAVLMQFVAEAQPAAPPRGPGKAAAANAKEGDGGSFGAVFAGLMATDQPAGGEKDQPAADAASDARTAADATPGLIPGMWSFVPLAPMAATTTENAQPDAQASAITPLTAANGQPAQIQIPPQSIAPAVDQQGMQQAIAEAAARQTDRQQPAPAAPGQQPQMPLTQATAQATDAKPGAGQPAVMMPEAGQPVPAQAPQAMGAATDQPATDVPPATTQPAATAPPTAEALAANRTGQEQTATPAIMTTATSGRKQQPDKPGPATANQTDTDAVIPGDTRPQAAAAAVTPNGDAQAAGDDGNALAAGTFAPTSQESAPVPETTANQPFAVYVDQASARQPASDAGIAPVSGQPEANQDPHNVAGQIVDHARLISRAENSEMVIRLKPEHLGELTLKIAVDSGVVSATFHTSNAEVRAAIEASLPQLRQDMANQGLKVDNVGVYASLDHFFANDQRHAPQQQQQLTVRRPRGDEAFADTVAAVTVLGAPTATAGGGIDYRI